MIFAFIRQALRPLFGVERRETASKFMYAILTCGVIILLAMIVFRWLGGATLFNNTTQRLLITLFVLLWILLFVVRRGYVSLAGLTLTCLIWISITYQAWSQGGIRDAAISVYVIVLFIAALLTNWQISFVFTILSITSIWILAITEVRGLRISSVDSPLNIARDLTAIYLGLFLLVYLVIDTSRHSLEAVREGEEKFRKIFHVSPVAIAIVSLQEGRLLDANRAYWKLSGLDPNLALGKTTIELGHWSGDAERQKFVNKLKEFKSLHNPNHVFKSASGAIRTTLAFHELIDVEHQPAVLTMFYDITEQKNSQVALEASEQKYRNFVEQSMEGIWFIGFDQPIPTSLPAEDQVDLIYRYGFVSDANDVFAQMYDYESSKAMRGVRLMELQVDGQVSKMSYDATLKLVKDGYRSGNRETQEQTRDGRTVYFLNNAVGVIEGDGLVGVWGTQLDITVLRDIEAALRYNEVRTRALLDAIPDMIFEFKRDGTILQFIASATSRPLLPPEQFLGKTIRDVLPVSVADQTMFFIERVLDTGQVHAFDYQLFQDEQNKTFEARLTKLSMDTVLAIVRDVSLQKWILGEREKLISELELKNAELERFTYTASHDLKAPLITIKGFLGFLREDAKNGNLKRLETDMQRISDAADKMQRLLNDLLELSRIGRLVNKSEFIDLNEMIAEVLELLQGRLSGGKVPVQVDVEAELPRLFGDRPRLLEVWQNLIDNAAKFMGDQPNPLIEIGHRGKTGDGSPIFFVRDNGIGIDPRFNDRIFGLFDKLDPQSEGTGIGLALVRRIVEFHGGRVWLESELGQGTTFYFTLAQSENTD